MKSARQVLLAWTPPTHGGSHEGVVGFFGLKSVESSAQVEQIEFLPGAGDQFDLAGGLKAAQDGRTDHTPVTGDVDF